VNVVNVVNAALDTSGRPRAAMLAALDDLAGTDMLVVGDVMLDSWIWGPPRGLSREGPVPVVAVRGRTRAPGGAGNAAVAAAAIGARPRLAAVVGDDADGTRLRGLLTSAGVDTASVLVERDRETVHKQRVCSGDHLHLRVDCGDERPPAAAVAEDLRRRLLGPGPAPGGDRTRHAHPRIGLDDTDGADPGASAAAVLVCDYGAGLFSTDLVSRLGAAPRGGRPLVVDAHDPRRWAGAHPDVVTPNAGELRLLLPPGAQRDFDADRPRTVAAHGAAIRAASGARVVVATLDRDGLVVLDGQAPPWHLPAEPAPDGQTSGAGDTLAATLSAALGAGAPLEVAVRLAATAASVVVRRPGTSVCTADDLRGLLGPGSPPAGAHDLADVAERVRAARGRGRRIVLTNGCFDVLHRGHVAYLAAAHALGDLLIVGVNSDASVRRLKGPGRPVNPLADRLAVLRALTDVDHLVAFDGDTASELITALRPDVYVKGGDYTETMLPEAALVRAQGGEIAFVDYVADHSTTAVLDRIRAPSIAPDRHETDAGADDPPERASSAVRRRDS
jgi:rfaE bifunctional protein nucleotidyltransferase chain/domain